jgi:hypothetical protein
MPKDPKGNSTVQMEAEVAIRELLKKHHGPLRPAQWPIDDEITVNIDAVSDDNSIFIEIFARQGNLLDGQKKKLAKDILKLALIGVHDGIKNRRLIIAHANPAISKHLTERSWVSSAARKFGIEEQNLFEELPAGLRERILEAQAVQAR